MSRRAFGREGEQQAADFLVRRGLKVLERNYQNRYGEIDLIAKDGEVLVFVEVKSWNVYGYSDLEYALGREKQRKIMAVAKDYLRRFGYDLPVVRFDLLFYIPRENRFEHIPNAFAETGKL